VPVVSALWLAFTPPRVVTVTAAPVDTDCVEKPINLSALVEKLGIVNATTVKDVVS
jgi:hypothetical protein